MNKIDIKKLNFKKINFKNFKFKKIDFKNMDLKNKIKLLITKINDINFKSISTKLIIYFSLIILLSSITLGLISTQKSSSSLTNEAEKTLGTLAYEAAKTTESRLETQQEILNMIAVRGEIQRMNWSEQQTVLKNLLTTTSFQELGIIKLDGSIKYSSGISATLEEDNPARAALNGEKNIVYFDVRPSNNETLLFVVTPIERNGEVVGAMLGRRNGNALSVITDDTGFGDEGYGYIIDSTGTIIAHPDRANVTNQFNPITGVDDDRSLKSISKLFEKILKDKAGVSNYSFEGNDLYAGFAPIENTDWMMVIAAAESEILAAIPQLRNSILVTLIIILAASIVATYIIGKTIAKPIIN